MTRRRSRFLAAGLSAAAITAAAVVAGAIENDQVPVLPGGPDGTSALRCETSCSPTKLRTPLVTLTWSAPRETIEAQRLNVTAYKNGFERGLYVTLAPVRAGQKFSPPPGRETVPPPLRRLSAVEIRLPEKESDRFRVTIEGIEPGVTYFWRVSMQTVGAAPSGTVRCEAPICPADIERERPQ